MSSRYTSAAILAGLLLTATAACGKANDDDPAIGRSNFVSQIRAKLPSLDDVSGKDLDRYLKVVCDAIKSSGTGQVGIVYEFPGHRSLTVDEADVVDALIREQCSSTTDSRP